MNEDVIRTSISDAEEAVSGYVIVCNDDTSRIRKSLREYSMVLHDEIGFRIAYHDTYLVRVTNLLIDNATYHILTGYHHASPGLIAFITGAIQFVLKVVGIITTINDILVVLTHETLAHWIGELIPGFEDAWASLMNSISEFSNNLGWGVDGVLHLMNATEVSANLYGSISGKSVAWVESEKWKRKQHMLMSYSQNLDLWQANPGEMMGKMSELWSKANYSVGTNVLKATLDKIGIFGEKAEEALVAVGTITDELLAIQTDMPAFIANNIPQGVWDGIEKVDTIINDRILPTLTDITDRIDELDAMVEAYQAKAAEIADKLAHPGDLLADIENLPDFARQNQLVKIDGVTSMLMKEENEDAFNDISGDLTEFGIIASALEASPPPLSFMELELPGRSPGITPEPRETWILTSGDY